MGIALYARKSVERENSISCETQLEYCRAMIKPEERNEAVFEFVDNGYSGGNINRDGFKRMMCKIESGEISKVLVYRLDRISRSLTDFVGILNTFKKYGVEFVSTQEAFDTSSPYGELIVKILAVFAEFERQSIIARVTQAYEHRSEMGLYMGGRRPYGYELEPAVINNTKTKKLRSVQSEAEWVKYIFQTYSAEGMTLGKLAEKLKEEGNGGWTTSKLSTILKNPIYVMADWRIYGYFQNLGIKNISAPQCFDGVHGVQLYGRTKKSTDSCKAVVMMHHGIIPADMWLKCQYKLQNNKRMGSAVSNKTSWLGGKIKCGLCARTMTTVKGKETNGNIRRYFVCTGKTHYKTCKGTACTLYADSIEQLIYNEISNKLEEIPIGNVGYKLPLKEINLLSNKLRAVDLAEEQLAESLLCGNFNEEMIMILNKKAQQLNEERMKLKGQIEEAAGKSQKQDVQISFSDEWGSSDYEQKRWVCRLLINSIIVAENGDLEIVWRI